MLKTLFWTQSRARLQLISSSEEGNLNWLFLPGGPGLGSESLLPLLKILQLPGKLWLLDFPGDGSNTTSNNSESFSKWSIALIEAVSHFDQVVLVGHSTGGMYVLSVPELEDLLEGLILLDSAPNSRWQASFAKTVKKFPIPGLGILQERYERTLNNQTLKEVTLASAPYLFTEEGQALGIESLSSLPYNSETSQWSAKYFDQTYQAKWVPQAIPTLILAGEKDVITPLSLFKKEEQFNRENIIFKLIERAGHFPWIENPGAVAKEFAAYAKQFI